MRDLRLIDAAELEKYIDSREPVSVAIAKIILSCLIKYPLPTRPSGMDVEELESKEEMNIPDFKDTTPKCESCIEAGCKTCAGKGFCTHDQSPRTVQYGMGNPCEVTEWQLDAMQGRMHYERDMHHFWRDKARKRGEVLKIILREEYAKNGWSHIAKVASDVLNNMPHNHEKQMSSADNV